MNRFEDRLLDDLLAAHGDELASAAPARRSTAPRRVLVGVAAVGAVTALAAGMTLFGATDPAYAVVQNPDGTLTVTIEEIGAIEPANAKLRELGIRATAVPMTTDCAERTAPYDGPADVLWYPERRPDGSVVVQRGGPDGHTVLLAMSTYPGGEGGLSFSGWTAEPSPGCVLDPRFDPTAG